MDDKYLQNYGHIIGSSSNLNEIFYMLLAGIGFQNIIQLILQDKIIFLKLEKNFEEKHRCGLFFRTVHFPFLSP